jgi:putative N6-adenine-specific DNA methylase
MEDAQQFYKEIGDVLKKQWKGWQVWIISGNLEAVKFVGLKPTRKFTLFNGAIECKFLKYEMY